MREPGCAVLVGADFGDSAAVEQGCSGPDGCAAGGGILQLRELDRQCCRTRLSGWRRLCRDCRVRVREGIWTMAARSSRAARRVGVDATDRILGVARSRRSFVIEG